MGVSPRAFGGKNLFAPKVTVTPAASSITTEEALTVTITVRGDVGKATPTGSVKLVSGKITSPEAELSHGSARIVIPAGTLTPGWDSLAASYTPNAESSKIYKDASGKGDVTVSRLRPAVKVTPSSSRITTEQPLTVTVDVSAPSGKLVPQGSVRLVSGGFLSDAAALEKGSASIEIHARSLAPGNDTLTVVYSPNAASYPIFKGATGAGSVTVNEITPTLTVTPSTLSTTNAQALPVTVIVNGGTGNVAPTGSVTVTGGSFTSAATPLANGSASIVIPAGSLAVGSDTLTAAYTPNAASARIYTPAANNSDAVTVVAVSIVAVDQSATGPAVTDQLLGMNMAAWFDPTQSFVVPGFQAAGIKALRWPGGSWSDEYHWRANMMCQGTPPNLSPGGWADPKAVYTDFINDLQIPLGADVALTADYGTDAACTGPGDPTEASGWVQAWEKAGGTVSHVTVGNEEYGSWETDLHASQHDPATYASAAKTYYSDVKAVDKKVLVGVDVDADNATAGWDATVLGKAKGSYDFVEFHFYPQAPGSESDTYITQQAAQDLTNNINNLKTELANASAPNTPIYVGEIGSVYANPGRQSWSITQGLYAGQALGEMMNDGVSRLTWWIGFGNCNGDSGNDSSSVYGWQTFGAYNVFSDGSEDTTCPDAGSAGTMSPSAQAFNLMKHVLVNGESVLSARVTGDTTDVRAYAATHSGGTAVVLFNLNETTSEPVAVTLSKESASSGVTVETYSKAIYDQSRNNVWAPPTTTNLGAQTLPLVLTLAPWSMNVVIIQ
jgi:hypothetical protein